MCVATACDELGWGNGRSVNQRQLDQLQQLEQLEQFQLISCGEATEREARSIPQRAVREAHCELCVTQKVIDALLKALSTPGGQNLVFKLILK